MAKSKSDPVAKFVTGAKQTKTPKPKSLTPGTKSNHKADIKREGKGARSVNY